MGAEKTLIMRKRMENKESPEHHLDMLWAGMTSYNCFEKEKNPLERVWLENSKAQSKALLTSLE